MKSSALRVPSGYAALFAEVKTRIRTAQYAALKAVNHELIELYWDIGRMIVARQQNEGWGKAVVELLATDFQKNSHLWCEKLDGVTT